MRVFVTGVYGYIGSVLAPYLATRGFEVVGFDTGYYRDGWLFSDDTRWPVAPYTINKDIRLLSTSDIEGCQTVVHLAELSNDPLGQNKPEVTYRINHQATVRLAELARGMGVERFVYTSSCSVYGAGTGDFLDESTLPNPQTAYANCKLLVERDVARLAGDSFCPVFLRNSTAYGPSPRMRFDVVLNDLCALAWTTRRIAMVSDGSPWRPVVHVEDICEAIHQSLVAPADRVRGEIFNVGNTSENYRIRELAEVVRNEFSGCEVTVGASTGDNRSYRVNCDKISRHMPDFRCRYSAADGARQLHELFRRIAMTEDTYRFRAFTRLKQLKYLQETDQIDDEFFWSRG